MALPAFASLDDLAARLGIAAFGDIDEARAQAALNDASALIRAETSPVTWITEGEVDADLPEVISTTTLQVARRAFNNPDGLSQETIEGYSWSGGIGGLALTDEEAAAVKAATGLVTGLTSIRVRAPACASGSRPYHYAYCDDDEWDEDCGS